MSSPKTISDRDDSRHSRYFVSMTDMMAGMIFLFIIMLMLFAFKLERAASINMTAANSVLQIEDILKKVLTNIRDDLLRQGFVVDIFPGEGVLTLPENILFEKDKADLSQPGQLAVAALGESLQRNLACYAWDLNGKRDERCPPARSAVEAVLIEGHTDTDGAESWNWELSVQRSYSTYKYLLSSRPDIISLRNKSGQEIFSIAGYGMHRPAVPNTTSENKRRNRRVNIRIIMVPVQPN